MNKSFWERNRRLWASMSAQAGHIPTAALPPQGVSHGNEPRLSQASDREGQGKAQ
jgi:hypothetical protein